MGPKETVWLRALYLVMLAGAGAARFPIPGTFLAGGRFCSLQMDPTKFGFGITVSKNFLGRINKV